MDKETRLRDITFTVLDTEATGMGIDRSDIIELSAVQVKPEFELDLTSSFSKLIRPRFPITYSAYKVHNISPEMVADKPFIEDILPSFIKFSENTIAVGHNIVKYDMLYLEKAAKQSNYKLPFIETVDTLKLTRRLFKKSANHRLTTLIDYFEINIDSLPASNDGTASPVASHRALYDATCTAIIFIKCLEALEKKGIHTLFDLAKHRLL